MTQTSKIRVLVLGSKAVGKSAVSVRFVTKRYIGEYQSNVDILYKKEYTIDDSISIKLEILDISCNSSNLCLSIKDVEDRVHWANAFLVVYSICDKQSFRDAEKYIETITSSRRASHLPITLLGNKRDLEPGRQVGLNEGRCLAHRYQCQFYEVSAAESCFGILLAWEALIKEVRAIHIRPTQRFASFSSQNRKLRITNVSKVIGAVFGRNSDAGVSYSSTYERSSSNEKQKRAANLLNGCKPKKPPNAIMIQVKRETIPAVLSL
ncbi:MRAS2-like protein [Dinothrombium tinctorium]|uniref:small monomeric GTPase n=1 Tax=Dinothrombium tinctorium TaxID=1965070 RepID=A0A3S3SHN2_9ACAR|nr:MRAS2-like protein [Dinothrombium tinctorium]